MHTSVEGDPVKMTRDIRAALALRKAPLTVADVRSQDLRMDTKEPHLIMDRNNKEIHPSDFLYGRSKIRPARNSSSNQAGQSLIKYFPWQLLNY